MCQIRFVRRKDPIPEDIAQALTLVVQGKLYALQRWIADGKRVRGNSEEDEDRCCLFQACEKGFHSMVELLLQNGAWGAEEKDRALNRVMENQRLDLVELLLAAGANPRAIDFYDACQTLNLEWMARMLTIGVQAGANNAFARALDKIKARPLLRFYRDNAHQYPELNKQASLALVCAVKEQKVKWAALLVWAGADPFMQTPGSLYHDWELEEYDGAKAAEVACYSGNADLVKVLHLKPTAEQAQQLLYRVIWHPNVDVMRQLLRCIPSDALNIGERSSCEAVERIIERRSSFIGMRGMTMEQEEEASVNCLEVLLDAGAKWNPDPSAIGSARRNLVRNSPRFIVRILRLLIYIPGAASKGVITDLCRTPVIRQKIYQGDSKLAKEMEQLLQATSCGRNISADV